MSTIAGRWDDYSLGVAIGRHNSTRLAARDRSEEIDDEIALLEAEQIQLGQVACRHHNAEMRLAGVRRGRPDRSPSDLVGRLNGGRP